MDYYKKKYKKKYSADAVLQKMFAYCSYQERCHYEVRSRVLQYEIYGDELEQIISELIEQDYLNEERFARSYVRGKFNIKSWGKVKIIQGLKFKKISQYCIDRGLEEIDPVNYDETLLKVMSNKRNLIKESDSFKIRQKLFQFALQKGYHSADINRLITQLVD